MLRPRSATRARNISRGGQRLGRSGVIWGSWRGRAARPEGHGGSSTRSPKRAPRAPLICIYLHDQKRRELKEEEEEGGGRVPPLTLSSLLLPCFSPTFSLLPFLSSPPPSPFFNHPLPSSPVPSLSFPSFPPFCLNPTAYMTTAPSPPLCPPLASPQTSPSFSRHYQ